MDRHFIKVRHPWVADKPVEVYRNLHQKCWSIRQGGLVVAHAKRVYLRDVEFRVRESGRQKVIREQRKNVHAWIRGYLCLAADIRAATAHIADDDLNYGSAYYNPYSYETFVDKRTNLPIMEAEFVDMDIDDLDPVVAIWATPTTKESSAIHSMGTSG